MLESFVQMGLGVIALAKELALGTAEFLVPQRRSQILTQIRDALLRLKVVYSNPVLIKVRDAANLVATIEVLE